MWKLALTLILCAALLAACQTQPGAVEPDMEPPPPSPEVSFERESEIINQSITDIALASPESLSRAMQRLTGPEAGESDTGAELIYVASRIRALLYPLLEPPAGTVLPPSPASIYPRLFEAVREGRFPQVPLEQASFLALVIPPLSLLFSTDAGVQSRSVAALQQALVMNPNSVLPHYLLGVVAERSGNMEAAYQRYSTALAIAASCYPARLGIARIEISRDRFSDAVEQLTVLNASLPSNAAVLGLLAEATFGAGDPEEASSLVLRAIQLSRDDLGLLLLRAEIMYALGRPDSARSLLSIVEAAMPENRRVLLLRIQLLRDAGRGNEALEVAGRARRLFPGDGEFNELYGTLLIEGGESEEGRRVLERTLEGQPVKTGSLEVLLADAVRREEWEPARGYVERLLQVSDDRRYLQQAALISRNLGEIDDAVSYAERLYRLGENHTDAALLYGRMLIESGNVEPAVDVLDQAIEGALDQQMRSELYVLRAAITDDAREKVRYLGESLMDSPQNVEALVRISQAYEELGEVRNAYRMLRQAAALRPEDEALQQKVAELRRRVEE